MTLTPVKFSENSFVLVLLLAILGIRFPILQTHSKREGKKTVANKLPSWQYEDSCIIKSCKLTRKVRVKLGVERLLSFKRGANEADLGETEYQLSRQGPFQLVH